MVFFFSPKPPREARSPIVPRGGGDVGLGAGCTWGSSWLVLSEANNSKELFFSVVRAEDKGVGDWQGHDSRPGMQEDLHCEL